MYRPLFFACYFLIPSKVFLDSERDGFKFMLDNLNNIRVVLIETSHSGNIGATARAMKNMGLSDLVLVNPIEKITGQEVAMASNALDLLDQARRVETLDDAISDCHLVLGTSARKRYLDWPLMTPRDAAQEACAVLNSDLNMKVAVLFGRERNGLLNEELEKCQAHIHIPTNPDYSSLNLAQAVQIIAYELRLACLDEQSYVPKDLLATPVQLEGFYQAVEETLLTMGFLDPKAPRKLMPRLRRLFQRVQMESVEVNIMRGIFEEMKRKL